MPPYGLYSLTDRVNIPEELAARGYGQDVLYDYDPAFGELKTIERYQPAPFTGARPFQAMYDIAPYTSEGFNLGFNADLYNPSFGGVSRYRDTGGIMGIEPVRYSADFDTSYGVANEPDEEQVEYLGDKPKGGIANLFKTILGFAIPGAGLLMSGGQNILGGIQNLNQRLRATDFGQSKTLQEYFERKRQRAQAKRAQEAMPSVYKSARQQGFTNDRGGFSTTSADKAGTSLGSGQFSPSTSRGRSGY